MGVGWQAAQGIVKQHAGLVVSPLRHQDVGQQQRGIDVVTAERARGLGVGAVTPASSTQPPAPDRVRVLRHAGGLPL